VHIRLTVEGRLDEQDFDNKLAVYGERVELKVFFVVKLRAALK